MVYNYHRRYSSMSFDFVWGIIFVLVGLVLIYLLAKKENDAFIKGVAYFIGLSLIGYGLYLLFTSQEGNLLRLVFFLYFYYSAESSDSADPLLATTLPPFSASFFFISFNISSASFLFNLSA